MLASLAARFATFVALSTLAIAQTNHWVVAPSLGAGVDFTRIQSAIDASVEGDVIRVRAGAYASFRLNKALTLLGDPGVSVSGRSAVTNVGSSLGARVLRFKLYEFSVFGCAGPVLCDRLEIGQLHGQGSGAALHVLDCADFRLHRSSVCGLGICEGCSGGSAAWVEGSRAEFVSCQLTGGIGWEYWPYYGAKGGDGLGCVNSDCFVALSNVIGGSGSYACGLCGLPGGDGGDGVRLLTSRLVLSGVGTNVVSAGPTGGSGGGCCQNPGTTMVLDATSTVRHSGVTIFGPMTGPNITLAVPPDPTLELIGDPSAGAPVTFRLHAEPGLYGRLQQGDRARVDPDGLSVIPKLNNRIRIHHLGMVGASGAIDYPAVVPTSAAPGWMRVFQGLEIDQPLNDLIERTNSVVVIAN